MRRSEAEEFYDLWGEGVTKVFSYHREFYPKDFLSIRKQKPSIVVDQTTCKELSQLDRDTFLDMLCKEELKLENNYSSYMDMIDLKTGGCDMGCWILGPDVKHDPNCSKSKNRFGWGYS